MTWELSGQLEGVWFEVSATGERKLLGGGASRFTYDDLTKATEGIEELVELIEGSDYIPGEMGGIGNIRTEWRLTTTSDPMAAPSLRERSVLDPAHAFATCQVLAARPEHDFAACLHINLCLPAPHFDLVYQHFFELLRDPRAQYVFTVPMLDDLMYERVSLGARTAREFLAGELLVIPRAEIGTRFQPGASLPVAQDDCAETGA